MEVKVISEKKKLEFKPFKMEVSINSLEEAGALAILAAGFNTVHSKQAMSMADVTTPKFPSVDRFDLVTVVTNIGKAARQELEKQGFI